MSKPSRSPALGGAGTASNESFSPVLVSGFFPEIGMLPAAG
ncbi:MAG: hypothetical protein WB998_14060 [Solirubrobacteraceae bacterium]